MLFLRKKISSLHFNERHSAAFLRPQAVSCANPQNFIFFLNQLHLHFTEPSEASSLSGCESGWAGDMLGCTSGVVLSEPGPSPSQHKYSDSSNASLSASLWLLWQLLFPCRRCMCRYGCKGDHIGLLSWAVTGMENSSLQYPAVSTWTRKHLEHSSMFKIPNPI